MKMKQITEIYGMDKNNNPVIIDLPQEKFDKVFANLIFVVQNIWEIEGDIYVIFPNKETQLKAHLCGVPAYDMGNNQSILEIS